MKKIMHTAMIDEQCYKIGNDGEQNLQECLKW